MSESQFFATLNGFIFVKILMEHCHNTDVVSLLDMVIRELRGHGGAGRNMETCAYEVTTQIIQM